MSPQDTSPLDELESIQRSGAGRAIKRLIDILAAGLGLAASSPILFLSALLIKLASPRGPVLFTQRRVGKDEKPFVIYKFRTMHSESYRGENATVTVRDDPRLILGGRLIRKYKVDELPQLLNVLNGTMSLVGPRPTVWDDVRRMTARQRLRHRVRPGISGLAQIRGGTAMSWPKRIEHDLEYLRHQSLGMDLAILAKTLWLVVFAKADTHPPGEGEWED